MSKIRHKQKLTGTALRICIAYVFDGLAQRFWPAYAVIH